MSTSCLRKLNREREIDLKNKLLKAYKNLFKIGVNLNSRTNYASLLWEGEKRLSALAGVDRMNLLIIDHERQCFIKLNIFGVNTVEETKGAQDKIKDIRSKERIYSEGQLIGETDQAKLKERIYGKLPEGIEIEGNLMRVPLKGLAHFCVRQKKTLVITEPLKYSEYDEFVDLRFKDGQDQVPIICVPVFNKENEERVEGCIQMEFKPKHYLSSNPFLGGSQGEFKLDLVAKESLEIFSN